LNCKNLEEKQMKRVAFILVIGIMIVTTIALASELAKPRIKPLEGQSKTQQKEDAEECREAVIETTGIDPDILEMKMRTTSSMHGRAARPGPRGSLTPSPGQLSQMDDYGSKIKEIEREYEVYLKAFAKAMEARGYEVKW
jgi:hypothetical protein